MLGVRVAREDAERVRLLIQGFGLLDKDRYIEESGGQVAFPLLARPSRDELAGLEAAGGALFESSFRERARQEPPFERIAAGIGLPDGLKELLPRKWEMLGDVLLLRLESDLLPHKAAVASAYADILGARTVALAGPIEGKMREQSVEVVLGSGTETVHLENGIRYKMDAGRLMFSSGNIDERVRVSKIDMTGETVVDMFAGIGYFALPMAVHSHAARVVAHEINPVAHRYLAENARLNRAEGVLEPVLGDNRDAEEGVADRVMMGYIKTTHEFLDKAIRILRPEGGIVHYHETCPNELLWQRPESRVAEAAERAGKSAKVLLRREVKSYAPGVSHVVLDVAIS